MISARDSRPSGVWARTRLRAVHDVAVGHDEAVRRNEKARAAAAATAFAGARLDVHDRGAGLPHRGGDRLGIGVEQVDVRGT